MRSKLDKLFDDPQFGKGAKDYDAGLMIYKNKLPLNYLILKYDDYYKVYLSLYDEHQNHLVSSKSSNLNVAKNLATKKIEKIIKSTIN